MNSNKIYKKTIEEVCREYEGAKEFINNKIKKLCVQDGILIDEVSTWFKANLFFIIFLAVKRFFVLKCKTYKDLKQHIFLMGVKSRNYFLLSKKYGHVFGFIEEGCYVYDKITTSFFITLV